MHGNNLVLGPEHVIAIYVSQGVIIAIAAYIARLVWKLSPILKEHKLMWFDYARRHGLPVEGDLHNGNGSDTPRAMGAAAGV
jgi:hypothetical protein